MRELFIQICLGIAQGITEWLPISSSGHLSLLAYLFQEPQDLSYDVFLHGASLIVLIVYFRRDIARLARGAVHSHEWRDRVFLLHCAVATVLTAMLALLIRPYEPLMRGYEWLIAGFIVNALLLFFSRYARAEVSTLNLGTASLIGIVQGIAVVPAISRSGITIAVALLLGLDKKTAFRFSFLIAIPALMGALILTMPDLAFKPVYLLGFIVTFIVGYGTLAVLERLLLQDKFHLFWMYNAFLAAIMIYFYAQRF